jgi:hypothetical protein
MIPPTSIEWKTVYDELSDKGYAVVPQALSAQECKNISATYYDEHLYRNTINMERYRFGKGEYKYFKYPLPSPIQSIRETFYTPLSLLANSWMENLGLKIIYPPSHTELTALCKSKGQTRPTPLILRYETGGYNTLHQDLYGDIYFPFQVLIVLSQPGKDYEGGELVLTSQVPRAQSRAGVIQPKQGDAVIFTTNFRPAKGSRGFYKVTMKHGISDVKTGVRYALGIIFHDAA